MKPKHNECVIYVERFKADKIKIVTFFAEFCHMIYHFLPVKMGRDDFEKS